MVDRRIADDTIRNRDVLKGFVVAIVVAGVVFLAIIGSLTLANTNTAVNVLGRASEQHGETLTHLDALTKQVKDEIAQLKSGTMTVDQILVEAGKVSTQLEQANHLICQAVHANC